MKKENVIKIANRISFVAIGLLLYWVFTFTTITVLGLKVFRQNITETFYLSILGILSILVAALIVNVMLNLTIISESLSNKDESDKTQAKSKSSLWRIIFILSFPLIGLFLYLGDIRTRQMKEKHLIKSAKYMVENNKLIMDKMGYMAFDSVYLHEVSTALKLISKDDKNFPSVSLIHSDTIGSKEVFIRFNEWFRWSKDKSKADFIYSATTGEREYMKNVFQNKSTKHRYTASDGNYELYYPVLQNNKIFILYFTDRQRYGKLGS
jgi:NADH:ubiquinone oxidoreductase subunit 5 (subunit L)/multisubunit Na+/H+ antiporter MnhA subunit